MNVVTQSLMNKATPTDAKLIEWLNNLIMLAQWDNKLPFYLVRLVNDPTAYQEFRTRVAGTTDHTEGKEEETPVSIARKKLLAAVASVPTLKELFAADRDPFDDAPPDHLQLLAEVSDITVKPPQMIYSRNGTLIAVVEALRQTQQLNPDSLIVDGLNKFFTLIEEDEAVAELLYELAKSPHWYVVLASLREDRDYTREEDPAVTRTLQKWQPILTPQLRKVLFQSGHLSRAPRKLIELAWTQRELFAEARQEIPTDAGEQNDPTEERRQVANEAFSLFEERAKPACEEIKAELNVLATVARHYVNVRKFAKLDGFVYTWPELARLAMSNYSALKYVEDLLVNRKQLPADADPDAQDLYKLCDRNERLIRFLRLRPYFSEINENELRLYQPLAPVVVTETTLTVDPVPTLDFVPEPPPPPPPAVVRPFAVRYLTIVPQEVVPAPQEGKSYRVSLLDLGNTKADGSIKAGRVVAATEVTFSVPGLLERILGAMGLASDAVLQETFKELFSNGPTPAESRMMRGGALLENHFFSAGAKENIKEVLSRPEPLRLLISSAHADVHYLPWEWLSNSSSTLLLSNPDHSVVRVSYLSGEIIPVALIRPLRVLNIVPDPPSGERLTADATIKGLAKAIQDAGAQYKDLVRSEATLQNITEALNTFRPHLVHFEGYLGATAPDGVIRPDFSQPASPPITVEEFGNLLWEKGVQLLTLGKNSLGRIYENTGATAAYLLSRKGLSAIIAPMRAIDEQSAMIFTTQFYSAFLGGNSLERSLHIARRTLASKGGDWSVFALFADPARLDDFQLLSETA
jgi:CHAT domain